MGNIRKWTKIEVCKAPSAYVHILEHKKLVNEIWGTFEHYFHNYWQGF